MLSLILALLQSNILLAKAYASSNGTGISTFEIPVGNEKYSVEYSMGNGGSITNVETNIPSSLSLLLTVESPTDGYLEMTFVRQTYDALSFTEHWPIVFVDGEEVVPEIGWMCDQITISIPLQARSEHVELAYGDILMEHTHGYPQIIDVIRTVEVDGQQLSIRMMTDSLKCDVLFLQQEKKFHIDIRGRSEADIEQGYFRLTIPHDLLGGNYTVLVDGRPVEFQEQRLFIKSNTDIAAEFAVRDDFSPYRASHLTFSYPVDAKSIDVIGTLAFPQPGMSDLNARRDLQKDPIILSYDISHNLGEDEARTIIDLFITDENSGELVKNVTFDLEMIKIGTETPLLVDEFYAENGTITFDITHQGPVQVSGIRKDFPYAWTPEAGTDVIPMQLPLEPDASYQLKIEILTTDYAHDFHPYPDESVYLHFATDSSEVGAIRVVPEFPYHIVLTSSVVIGSIIAISRRGPLLRFYEQRR